MLVREFWVLVAVGVAAWIVVLVVIGWRAVANHRGRARSRPASPEELADRRRTLRAIAAATYAKQTQHEKD